MKYLTEINEGESAILPFCYPLENDKVIISDELVNLIKKRGF